MHKYKISTAKLGWTKVSVLTEESICLETWLCPSVKSALEQINYDSIEYNGSKEYEYLEASLKHNTDENADFIRSIWTDKHERLLAYVDSCLDYLWDIVETERGAVIILMDSGLYNERYDETTIERISNNCEYLKFSSIDELEAWIKKLNIDESVYL